MDEGLPIAYEALQTGVAVYASGGEHVGTVAEILAAEEQDIFHGIVIETHGAGGAHAAAGGAHVAGAGHGSRRFVAADQIASLHERGVNLAIDAAAVGALPPPEADAPAMRVNEPGVKPSWWRKLWDRLSGADPRREDWRQED